MRTTTPRLSPLSDAELTDEQEALLQPMRPDHVLNIHRTLARAPKALERFNFWAAYTMSKRNALTPRQREIVILRIGFLCRSGYEFMQHRAFGLDAGLTPDEIEAIKRGGGPDWTEEDRLLIAASDELHRDQHISDPTWDAMRRLFTEKQCMDIVITAAQYTQVSMILNAFGVQLEDGIDCDPDLVVADAASASLA
jgi:alkylhydroperoxidase family enzyme